MNKSLLWKWWVSSGASALCPVYSHKTLGKVLCVLLKPCLMCQIQLRSVVIQLLCMQRFALKKSSAAVVSVPDGERLCFSNHMNEIQGYEGTAIFFPFTKPVGMETREDWLQKEKNVPKPDAFKENFKFESMFCWQPRLFFESFFFKYDCILSFQ